MKQTLLSPSLLLLILSASPIASSLASAPFYFHPKKNIISLTAESTGWSAELFWNAVFDKDLVAFAVQRSSDGVDYQEIITYDRHFVAAGDTESFREQDSDPMPGENFYRIRFTLADGEQVFSERRKLYFKEVAAFDLSRRPLRASKPLRSVT